MASLFTARFRVCSSPPHASVTLDSFYTMARDEIRAHRLRVGTRPHARGQREARPARPNAPYGMPSEALLGAGFWSAASRAAHPILSARTSRFGDLSPSGEGTRVAPGLCCQAFIEKLLKASERALCSLGVSIMREVAAVDNLDPEFPGQQ